MALDQSPGPGRCLGVLVAVQNELLALCHRPKLQPVALCEVEIQDPVQTGSRKTVKCIRACSAGCSRGEDADALLVERRARLSARVIPDVREKFLGAKILKTPIAYPVFLKEYESARKAFESSTNIDNLLSIGRNGEFSHIFMEDVYWRTRKKVGSLVESL